jgi:BarA-like signal transduction histidine kinase
VVVPACMASAMGMDPKEAAEKAAETANVIIAMPSVSLKKATQLASDIMKGLDF